MCRVIRLKELTPSVQTAVVIQSFKLQLPSSLSNCSCHPVLQTAVVIQSCKLQLPSSPENCSCHPAFQTAVVIQSCKLPLSSIQTAGDWRIQGIHLSNCRGLENSGNLSFKLQGLAEFSENCKGKMSSSRSNFFLSVSTASIFHSAVLACRSSSLVIT